ncbi:MAG: glycosyltransferase family 2 protein [Christiangramia sp.]|nr:glycosyltransferase family 2 protein [Christiangramia sp.]
MKVSIITATYNSASNISTAINSLNTQSSFDIEWVVIDGASKDDTVKIINDTFSGNLKMTSENDKGIYDALNKGIKKATGDIIGFLHSDDLLASGDIVKEVADIFQHNDVDGVYGDLQYVAKEDTSKIIRYWKSQNFTPSLLLRGWMPAHPTLFLKRDVYKKHGLFNLDYNIAADYDLMLRIFRDNSLKFYYLPKVITKMRVGGASNRSLKNIKSKSLEDYKALKANGIKYPIKVLAYKNLSKLNQFVTK